MSLGTNIMLRRLKLGMTQKELGEKLGITPSAVTRWERGDCNPTMEKLVRLARILECTAGDLLGESREENQK